MVRLWTGLRSCTPKANYLRKGLNMKRRYFSKKDIKEDKKVVKKKLLGLIQKRNNVILQYQRKLQKELGGLGKHFETAPSDLKSMKRRGDIRNLSKCAEPM